MAANDAESQLRMAVFYSQGQGVIHDESEMDKWLMAAARSGNVYAKFMIAMATKRRKSNSFGAKLDVTVENLFQDAAESGLERKFIFEQARHNQNNSLLMRLAMEDYQPAVVECMKIWDGISNSEKNFFIIRYGVWRPTGTIGQ